MRGYPTVQTGEADQQFALRIAHGDSTVDTTDTVPSAHSTACKNAISTDAYGNCFAQDAYDTSLTMHPRRHVPTVPRLLHHCPFLPQSIQYRGPKVSPDDPRDDDDSNRQGSIRPQHGANCHSKRRRNVAGQRRKPEGLGEAKQPAVVVSTSTRRQPSMAVPKDEQKRGGRGLN